MKKVLTMVFMTLCSLTLWADYPTEMYLVGDATPGGWVLNNATQMTRTADGVFEWSGSLSTGEMKFLCTKDWTLTNHYGPTVANTALVSAGEMAIENLSTNDKKFNVTAEGTYQLTLDLTQNKLIVGYKSTSGHYLYFKNTDSQWTNVYLRIGRADHVYTKAFDKMGESEWYRCETPDYNGYTLFTITDNADATAPVSTYPDGANRLYEYSYDLNEDRWFILTDGPNESGNHYYWNNTSTNASFSCTMYVVPSELFTAWDEGCSVKASIEYLHFGTSDNLTKEVNMEPIAEGSHIYKASFNLPYNEIYKLDFVESGTQSQTYCVLWDNYVSADTWNGKIFSRGKNDDAATEWFTYEAPQIATSSEYKVYFDNSLTNWDAVYLRIGRTKAHGYSEDYLYSHALTQIDNSNIWYCNAPDFENAEAWTITNVAQDNGGYNLFTKASEVSSTMERVYYYRESITGDIVVTPGAKVTEMQDPFGVTFWTATKNATEIYNRTVTSGRYGTICLPKAATVYSGATLFRLVDKTTDNGIVIEEVTAMEAGTPYIFLANADQLQVTMSGEEQAAQSANGLVGYIGDAATTLTPDGTNRYVLSENKLWLVDIDVTLPSNRAYIDMSDITSLSQVPGRQRFVIENKNTTLGTEQVLTPSVPTKKLINGELFIILDQHIYSAQGQIIQ